MKRGSLIAWALLFAILPFRPAWAKSVYVFSGGDPAQDTAIEDVLETQGHDVVIGMEYWEFTGDAFLDAFDVVILLNSANRDAGDMPASGQVTLRDYVRSGHGLVTGEWVTWNVTRENFLFLYEILPAAPDGVSNDVTPITYTEVEADPILNQGVSSAFLIHVTSYGDREANFIPVGDATIFYDSDNLGPGLVGRDEEYGRVISFSTPIGPAELGSLNYAHLLSNAVNWAGASFVGIAQQWDTFVGGEYHDEAMAVVQTEDGGYVFAGRSNSFTGGDLQAYLVKLDPFGAEEWSRTIGGTGLDEASAMRITPDGGFILAGRTASMGAGANDVLLIKTDANGNEEWSRAFGGTGFDEAYGIDVTSDGGYIIAGMSNSFAPMADLWLIRTDADGNELWSHTYGGANIDQGRSVRQTADGGFIAAGFTASFGAGGGYNAWLVKTDPDGNEEWTRTVGYADVDEYAQCVQQTSDGGYVLTGWSYLGGIDVFLVKTDGFGNILWQKFFGGTEPDMATSVVQTPDGGYLVGGTTASYGFYDMWAIKTDAHGNKEWDRVMGITSWLSLEWANDVALTRDGGYVLAGMGGLYGQTGPTAWVVKLTPNTFSVDWSGIYGWKNSEDLGHAVARTADGGFILAGRSESGGDVNGLLVRTDAQGRMLWDALHGGADDDVLYDVLPTADGGFVATGTTRSAGAGSDDAWLLRTDADGVEVWSKTFGKVGLDHTRALDQARDGYILAGDTYGRGSHDVWLVKTDFDGNLAWEVNIGDETNNEIAYSVRTTSDGGYIIGGYVKEGFVDDALLIKTDPDGNVEWDVTFGDAGSDRFVSAEQTADGGYIAAGYQAEDALLVKLDASGRVRWSRTYGGSAPDAAECVQQTADGGYLLAGWTKSFSSGSLDDAWVVKTDATGILEWHRAFGGGDTDRAQDFVQTPEGACAIAGLTYSDGSGAGSFWLFSVAPTQEDYVPPTPDIHADGVDDRVIRRWGEEVEMTFSLAPGTLAGQWTDWWYAIFWYDVFSETMVPIAVAPLGTYPLVEVAETDIHALSLDPGLYVCMVIIDETPDAEFQFGWFDYVVVEWTL